MKWRQFELASPELAAIGRDRLGDAPAYLATIRADGRPRLHPVTPILTDDKLWLFMEPTSPKGRDLVDRHHYTLHCRVDDAAGGKGEFVVSGRGAPVFDAAERERAAGAAQYRPREHYVLFELEVDEAMATRYDEGEPRRLRWKAPVT